MTEVIPRFESAQFRVIAIGSSTGGPSNLTHILSGLPADMPVPILIAQHLPPVFTESFAVDLDRVSPLSVVHSEGGMPVYPGVVYLARGRQHMRVRQNAGTQVLEISSQPVNLLYMPSVDELFGSCAKVYGPNVLGVVMTGIGSDGTKGATQIHQAGGTILTQSQATCAVYGMPRSCDKAGISTASLSPEGIQQALLQLSPSHDSEMELSA